MTRKNKKLLVLLKKYLFLYFLILPVIAYLLVYRYYPILTQAVMSFKNYRFLDGIWGSPWSGLSTFRNLFAMYDFHTILRNTIFISIMRYVIGFFPPIILAVLLYDVSSQTFKRFSQTVFYLPNFLSWVVTYALVYAFFSNTGLVNMLTKYMFGAKAYDFLLQNSSFYILLFGSDVWKNVGFGTILYMAGMMNIGPELYDSAKIDGAGPLQRIRHVTLPGIKTVIIFVLTMSIGNLFRNTGSEQILLFYTPATYGIADVIDTWIYRQGLLGLRYDLGSALSLLQSIIGFIMVISVNKLTVRYFKVGLW